MGAFASNDRCTDNPTDDAWYNVLYFGLSSEQVILAFRTWEPKTMYYGILTVSVDEPITWIEITHK